MKKVILNLGTKPTDKNYNAKIKGWATALSSINDLQTLLAHPLSELTDACDELDSKEAEVIDLERKLKNKRGEVAAAKEKRDNLASGTLTAVQNYVDGDATKANDTFTKFVERTGGVSKPNKPVISKVNDGSNRGSVHIFLAASLSDATSYQVRYTLHYGKPDAQTILCELVFTNMRKLIIEGLPSATEIAIEVRGNNTAGNGAWSDMHFKVVS